MATGGTATNNLQPGPEVIVEFGANPGVFCLMLVLFVLSNFFTWMMRYEASVDA